MKIFRFINKFTKKLNEDHVGEYTAQCAYFTFLSFIPFIILLLSLIKYMNIDRKTLVYVLEAILPTMTRNSVLDIIQEVYSKSIQTVSISAIFTLWSATNSFYALSLGLSSIYKGEEKSKNHILLRIRGVFGTVITLVSIIFVLILIVFGNRINSIMQGNFPMISKIGNFIIHIRVVIVLISLFIIFTLIYKFIPNKKDNRLIKQIPGAIFTAIGWVIVSYFFSIYVDIFTDFSVIYGSLATITLILMWLYSIIYIILIGAEINVLLEKIKSWLKFSYYLIVLYNFPPNFIGVGHFFLQVFL